MKVLVIGLGSMGKRRIRNLHALGIKEVGGVDLRADRRDEAKARYNVRTHASVAEGLAGDYEAAIVSLPPDLHVEVALACIRSGKPTFVEAGVMLEGMGDLVAAVEASGLVGMPSCTMRYFPGPRMIRQIVDSGELGKPLFWRYHSGQCLLDWHPWESISDYYVSKRATGGCREIVPFELTWLTHVFGDVTAVRGRKARVGALDADIDDVYTAEIHHEGGTTGQLTVDVLSRPAVRDFYLVGQSGNIRWDGIANTLQTSDKEGQWVDVALETGHPEEGYMNPEEPYQAEIRDFLSAVRLGTPPDHTFRDDMRILQTLDAIERDADQARPTVVQG